MAAPAYGVWSEVTTWGGPMRYVLSGLRMRFKPAGGTTHAHNASGYGAMALVSGKPYVVTVYGSEVYNADTRSWLYRALVNQVLKSAAAITCTAPAMADYLIRHFGIDPSRIHMFSMGISTADFSFDATERTAIRRELGVDNRLVITSNRRVRPQYRIDLLVRAFQILRAQSERFHLMILEGDATPEYAHSVRALVRDLGLEESVSWVTGMRGQSEIRRYLLASDIVMSLPDSDQLSASILEALAMQCSVCVSPLPAYRELLDAGLAHAVSVEGAEILAASIAAIAERPEAGRPSKASVREWLDVEHSDEAVSGKIVELYTRYGVC